MCEINASVAIITRTYQRPRLLERCIQSVIALNYPNWNHIIVVNGGDYNEVTSLTEKYNEQYNGRITLVYLDEIVTPGSALNIGIRSSSADYVMILDDDDCVLPDCLSELLTEFDSSSPGMGVVYCQTSIVDEKIIDNEIIKIGERNNPFQHESINVFSLLKDIRFTPVIYMFRREVYNCVGNFNESEGALSQWEFWLKLVTSTEICFVDKILASWHNRVFAEGSDQNLIHLEPEHLRISYKEKYIQRKIANFDNDKIGHCILLFAATSAALKNVIDTDIYTTQPLNLPPTSSFMGKLFRNVINYFNRG